MAKCLVHLQIRPFYQTLHQIFRFIDPPLSISSQANSDHKNPPAAPSWLNFNLGRCWVLLFKIII